LEEEERVELPAIPDHGLPRSRTEQREEHETQSRLVREGFLERRARELTPGLDVEERGRFLQLEANVERDRDQHDREQERNAPSVRREGVAKEPAAREDHEQRQEQAERRRRLNPARVASAPTFGCVL